MAAEDPLPEEKHNRSRANLVAVAFIAILFLGAWWVFNELQHYRATENCIASGRRDCIPVVPTNGPTP